MFYKKIFKPNRQKISSVTGRSTIDELLSDRSRIVFSSSFRRLQQKAQVFSLEDNPGVRSRLAHSLEVADTGGLISKRVTSILIEQKQLDQELAIAFQLAVQNACLLHDIGNPPFGHFGEVAIREWFKKNWNNCFEMAIGVNAHNNITFFEEKFLLDFLEFDGNPQGLRMFTRLSRDRDKYGLNLTYTTIMSFIKYPRTSTEKAFEGIGKKVGYFVSEKNIVAKAIEVLGINPRRRFPITYIMEAADDISYCLSDIEDGIEKKIISCHDFFNRVRELWLEKYEIDDFPYKRIGEICSDQCPIKDESELMLDFKVNFTRALIDDAVNNYIKQHHEITEGKLDSLFPRDGLTWSALETLKIVARESLFCSPEAEKPEIAGLNVIKGILDCYARLLQCPTEKFHEIVDINKKTPKGYELEQRLFNRLPKKHVLSYQDQLNDIMTGENSICDTTSNQEKSVEWFLRAHLVLDYIAGMTDKYALETYQLLLGIKIV